MPTPQLLLLDQALTLIRSSEKTFYVYVLIDDKNLPFYVGKGTASRIASHEAEASSRTVSDSEEWETDSDGVIIGKELEFRYPSPKCQEIRRLWAIGVKVRYDLVSFFDTDDEAHDEEKRLIRYYGRRNRGTGSLTNLTDGGEGHSRDYPGERWEIDSDGVIAGKEIVFPSADQLATPRFRKPGKMGPEAFKVECAHPTGPEMPCLAFWQYAGWTIQVFWSANCYLPGKLLVGLPAYCVLFRFFDGSELLLQDRIDVPSEELVAPCRMLARILRSLSSENTATTHFRICRRCANVDFTKKLQAWCAHRRESLSRMADAVAGLENADLQHSSEFLESIHPVPRVSLHKINIKEILSRRPRDEKPTP